MYSQDEADLLREVTRLRTQLAAAVKAIEAARYITTDGRIGMAKVRPAALDDLQVALAAFDSIREAPEQVEADGAGET